MSEIFVGLGSNINSEENIILCAEILKRKFKIISASSFYLTKPISPYPQPDYVNGVIKMESSLSPHELKFERFKEIEEKLGRKRNGDRFSPRTIDIDLLLYNNLVLRDKNIVIPHPDIYRRPFLVRCIWEISPELVLPDTGIPVKKLLSRMDISDIKELRILSERIREIISS